MKRNAMLWSSNLDNLNPLTQQLSLGELYGALQQQVLIVSMKELYGWLALTGLLCLLLFLLKESDIRPQHALHPTYRAIRKLIKRELRTTKEQNIPSCH